MSKEITLNHITKIEGHAKLVLGIDKGKVRRCELSSIEGSRYFEGMLKGRRYDEAHEMTSRICGICSCAHVVTSLMAIENAMGVVVSEQTEKLRVLLTLGERIRSHATHLYFLALPDYLGYESALAMASKYKKELKQALHMMKVGNRIITLVGGRDLHPVSATVGGWLSLPSQEDVREINHLLHGIKKDALATCKLFFSLKYPQFESSGESFSLVDESEYAVLKGRFVSEESSFEIHEYRKFIKEYHEARSTANFVVKEGKHYMVGALSRLNNSSVFLSRDAQRMLKKSGIKLPSRNPFENNLAQAIEMVHCIDHALKMCEELDLHDEKVVDVVLREGTGVGAIEVPRGTLWHEYQVDGGGCIVNANIITPTAQNLLNIQEDIREFVPRIMHLNKEGMVLEIERLIRSYDPCFSCSAHFLEVNWC